MMAYEEKRNLDEDIGLEPILKFMRQLLSKWWLIVMFIAIFSISGFGLAKITYSEEFSSNLIFNVSNKDRDIAGTAATYTTASDAQASTTIATNFKTLLERGNDFITAVQANVKAQTGKTYSKEQLRGMMNVELVADSTLINITVTSEDKELAYIVATAIQSVYADIVKDAFPTANISVADSATQSELAADSSTLI